MKILLFTTISNKIFHVNASKYLWLPYKINLNGILASLSKIYDNNKITLVIEDKLIEGSPILHDVWHFETINVGSNNLNSTKYIAFYAASDTLVNTMLPIIRILRKNGLTCDIFVPSLNDEGAKKQLEKFNESYSVFNPMRLVIKSPDILVFANDWAIEPKLAISMCKKLNIKTIIIQESVVNFGDEMRRMKWAEYPIIQGINTIKHLDRTLFFVAGNPRYEDLEIANLPYKPQALINCNFTYGIYEDIRYYWLNNIISVLEDYNIDYVISQHPRDNGNLDEYKNVQKSNSEHIHEQIKNSSFVITRFSSLIHESIIMGRRVIYYNPHNEKLFYDFSPDASWLFKANDCLSLSKCVSKLVDMKTINQNPEDYINFHVQKVPNSPSFQIAQIIRNIAKFHGENLAPNLSIQLVRYFLYYIKYFYKILFKNKNI